MIGVLKNKLKLLIGARLLRENRRVLQEKQALVNDRLRPDFWGCSVDDAGVLTAGGANLQQVAREFGTPLHVVNVEKLHDNAMAFLRAFSNTRAQVLLATSYKTNPVPFVLEKLHEWGTLAEVISPFELWLALELGVPGHRIIYNGPGKSVESLGLAVDHGLRLINIDSMEELEDLERICAARGRRQNIGLRVTTDVGWRSQFGLPIDEGIAFAAFQRASRSKYLNPIGVHLHLGTGLSSIDTYVLGISEVLGLGRKVNQDLGLKIRILDLGGGFGVATTRTTDEWDLRLQHVGLPIRSAIPTSVPRPEAYAQQIAPLVNDYFKELGLGEQEAELIFEPGRAITASAQMLLLSVMRVKRVGRTTPDVILDGGRNVCVPLGWEFHEIHPVGKMLETSLETHNLNGPLCHPHDIVARHKPFPSLETGDVVSIMDVGAYFIPSQSNFSNPRPGIVAIENGVAQWVRTQESYADIVRLDRKSPRYSAALATSHGERL